MHLLPQIVTREVPGICIFRTCIDRVGYRKNTKDQGPVIQSVVSLTSLLRVISLTVLEDSIHNILIFFFAEKI